MNRILLNKCLITALVVILVIISGLNIYRTLFYKSFAIFQSEQQVTIAFNNGKYLSLRPVADTITDSNAKTIKPFGEFNDYTFATTGINIGPFSNANTLNLSNQKATTSITVQQVGPQNLNLTYKITSNYEISKSFKYYVEIDYSGLSTFRSDSENISLVDDQCRVSTPITPNHQVTNFSDGRSLLFGKQYEKNLEFNINLNISCNEI